MNELTVEQLIRVKYSGSLSQADLYFDLTIQTATVLIAGIVLWRASVILHKKKKAQRVQNSFFDTPYSKGWNRKR
ncbi:MAG: hypothetical protein QNK23_01270 [Crocinitomicaceae bacterium]|nr:hypothetical protein [Crocinitomicaceae bacterium]